MLRLGCSGVAFGMIASLVFLPKGGWSSTVAFVAGAAWLAGTVVSGAFFLAELGNTVARPQWTPTCYTRDPYRERRP